MSLVEEVKSKVAAEFHVLSEAVKDAKNNSGRVSVAHDVLAELLAAWHSIQKEEPVAAEPIADQIHAGLSPSAPIDAPPVEPVVAPVVQAAEPAPADDEQPKPPTPVVN